MPPQCVCVCVRECVRARLCVRARALDGRTPSRARGGGVSIFRPQTTPLPIQVRVIFESFPSHFRVISGVPRQAAGGGGEGL